MNLDKVGITASLICAIHCSLLPIFIVIFPIFSLSLFATETFEWVFLIISLCLCIASLCFGFKKHKSFKAFSFAGMGFALLVIARMFNDHHKHKEFEFDTFNLILLIGGLLVATSHYINNLLCKRCSVCSEDKCCNG